MNRLPQSKIIYPILLGSLGAIIGLLIGYIQAIGLGLLLAIFGLIVGVISDSFDSKKVGTKRMEFEDHWHGEQSPPD